MNTFFSVVPKMNRSLRVIAGTLAIAATTLAVGSSGAIAQSLPEDANLSGDQGSGVFSGSGGNGASTMFNLIHRANLGQSRSPYEFFQDQQENLSVEATDFRTRQLELIRLQQQANPESSELTPASQEGSL